MQIYAIIKRGDREYRVIPGKTVKIDRMDAEPGETIDFDQVIELANGDQVATGKPLVAGARVRAQVVKHGQEKGVLVFRMKRRRIYQNKFDRPREFTSLKIIEIIFGDAVFSKNAIDPKKIKKAKALEEKKAKAELALKNRRETPPPPEPAVRAPVVTPEPVRPAIPVPQVGQVKVAPPPRKTAPVAQEKSGWPIIAVIALLLLLALIGYFWSGGNKKDSVAPEVETPPVDIRLQKTGQVDRPSAPNQPPE